MGLVEYKSYGYHFKKNIIITQTYNLMVLLVSLKCQNVIVFKVIQGQFCFNHAVKVNLQVVVPFTKG